MCQNNKGTDQPALLTAEVGFQSKITSLFPASIAEQASLNCMWFSGTDEGI